MKIALLISGRIKRYEVCLLPFLENNKDYDIDLFISINDNNNEYYDIVREKLKYWLKDSYIKPYILPDDFNYTNEFNFANIMQNNKLVPYYQMSMFFNDFNAFNLAYKYSKNNNIEYDIYMKYRGDIINNKMYDLSKFNKEILYTIPYMDFITQGIHKKKCVGATWDWGSYDVMKLYFETYNYILDKLKELNGNYRIAYECCLTDNCYDKNLKIEYIPRCDNYYLDRYRRVYDPFIRVTGDLGNIAISMFIEKTNDNIIVEASKYE